MFERAKSNVALPLFRIPVAPHRLIILYYMHGAGNGRFAARVFHKYQTNIVLVLKSLYFWAAGYPVSCF